MGRSKLNCSRQSQSVFHCKQVMRKDHSLIASKVVASCVLMAACGGLKCLACCFAESIGDETRTQDVQLLVSKYCQDQVSYQTTVSTTICHTLCLQASRQSFTVSILHC